MGESADRISPANPGANERRETNVGTVGEKRGRTYCNPGGKVIGGQLFQSLPRFVVEQSGTWVGVTQLLQELRFREWHGWCGVSLTQKNGC
jgi:hypothetical protein